MIIDRDIINQKFRYATTDLNHRFGNDEESITNKQGLCKRIDYWKYILYKDCNAKPGQNVALGISHTGIDYFALIFACAELGLEIKLFDFDNPKLKSVNIFIHHMFEDNSTYKEISSISDKVFYLYDLSDRSILNRDLLNNISARRPKPNNMLVSDLTHKDVFNLCKNYKIKDRVLHTKLQDVESFYKFFIPSFYCEDVSIIYALGYNIFNEGISKISFLSNKYQTNSINFQTSQNADIFLKNTTVENISVYVQGKLYVKNEKKLLTTDK